jgi:hypothetical protein
MNVKMVELGVGILRAEAEETHDNVVMRTWAIDTIERSTGRKFSGEERAALLHKALPIIPTSTVTPAEQMALDAVRQQKYDNYLDRAIDPNSGRSAPQKSSPR